MTFKVRPNAIEQDQGPFTFPGLRLTDSIEFDGGGIVTSENGDLRLESEDTGHVEIESDTGELFLINTTQIKSTLSDEMSQQAIGFEASGISFTVQGDNYLDMGSGETTFNQAGNDIDFRVEGNTEPNLLFVDAGNDVVLFGGTAAILATAYPVQIYANGADTGLLIHEDAGTNAAVLHVRSGTVDYVFHNNGTDLDIGVEAERSGTTIMRLLQNGRVGIGTATPQALLDVDGVAWIDEIYLATSRTTGGYSAPDSGDGVGGRIKFGSENTDRAAIFSEISGGITGLVLEIKDDSSDFIELRGDVSGVGAITILKALADGGVFMPNLISAASSTDVHINGSDELHKVSSSRIFKDAVQPLAAHFDSRLIYDLSPRSYKWNKRSGSEGLIDLGLVAEEAYEVMPELVALDAEGDPHNIRWDVLNTLMLAELQSIESRVSALEGVVSP